MSAALFIDYENVLRAVQKTRAQLPDPAGIILASLDRLIQEHEGASRILIRRAYADWEDVGMLGAQAALNDIGIVPIYVKAKRGKSSADIVLTMDAFETLLSRQDIEEFILVGGDRDYLPLVRRILESGRSLKLVGLQESMAQDLVALSKRFTDLLSLASDTGQQPAPTHLQARATWSEQEQQTACIKMLDQASHRYGETIFLGPFYRNFMNPGFAFLSDDGRKAIISGLEKVGAIKVEQRPQPNGSGVYTTVQLCRQHELVVTACAGAQ